LFTTVSSLRKYTAGKKSSAVLPSPSSGISFLQFVFHLSSQFMTTYLIICLILNKQINCISNEVINLYNKICILRYTYNFSAMQDMTTPQYIHCKWKNIFQTKLYKKSSKFDAYIWKWFNVHSMTAKCKLLTLNKSWGFQPRNLQSYYYLQSENRIQ